MLSPKTRPRASVRVKPRPKHSPRSHIFRKGRPTMQRITLLEELEQRRLLTAPIVDTFTATPSPLTRGDKVALAVTASDPDSDGSVKSVSFFVDTNNNQSFDADTDKRV